jgi:hypothetical protein
MVNPTSDTRRVTVTRTSQNLRRTPLLTPVVLLLHEPHKT